MVFPDHSYLQATLPDHEEVVISFQESESPSLGEMYMDPVLN